MAGTKTPTETVSTEAWMMRIRDAAVAAGTAGVSIAELGRPRKRDAAAAFDTAVMTLTRRGEIISSIEARTKRLFAYGFAPPSQEERFRREVLERVTTKMAWLDDVLAGKTKAATARRAVLDALVREGVLVRIYVATSATTKKAAYLRANVVNGAVETTWPAIEAAARQLASVRLDRTVSFEQLASQVGVALPVVKSAVLQRMTSRGGIQLVRGEARELREPSIAGIERDGEIYYRFCFLD